MTHETETDSTCPAGLPRGPHWRDNGVCHCWVALPEMRVREKIVEALTFYRQHHAGTGATALMRGADQTLRSFKNGQR